MRCRICVDAPVASGVEAVADRFAGALGGRCRQRRRSVEAREAALGEAPGIADLDEQLGDRPRRQAAELAERRVGAADQRRELLGGVALSAVQARDLGAVVVEHP
jgi:hypothetical protein